MKNVIGHTPCPECGETNEVIHDGRKHYIRCVACQTITSYQSKAAKARLLAKLHAEAEPEIPENPEPELPEAFEPARIPETPEPQQPELKPEKRLFSFFN